MAKSYTKLRKGQQKKGLKTEENKTQRNRRV